MSPGHNSTPSPDHTAIVDQTTSTLSPGQNSTSSPDHTANVDPTNETTHTEHNPASSPNTATVDPTNKATPTLSPGHNSTSPPDHTAMVDQTNEADHTVTPGHYSATSPDTAMVKSTGSPDRTSTSSPDHTATADLTNETNPLMPTLPSPAVPNQPQEQSILETTPPIITQLKDHTTTQPPDPTTTTQPPKHTSTTELQQTRPVLPSPATTSQPQDQNTPGASPVNPTRSADHTATLTPDTTTTTPPPDLPLIDKQYKATMDKYKKIRKYYELAQHHLAFNQQCLEEGIFPP